MAILRLLLGKGTPRRLRLMAMLNVSACCFVTVMTLLTSFMAYFVITPHISQHDEWMLKAHRITICYLFVNVCGNFLLCVRADTSTTRASRRRSVSRQDKNAAPTRTTKRGDSSKSTSEGALVLEGSVSTKGAPHDISPKARQGKTSAADVPASSRHDKSKSSGSPKSWMADTPERSHECNLCDKRILRRDHHCFFMTVCIGYHNHKHFIFFCLYMMAGALYGVIVTARYLSMEYGVRFWGPQTFAVLLVKVVHSMLFKALIPTPFFSLLLFQLYICLAVGLVAAGFLYWHLAITLQGQTTHEASTGDTRYRRRMPHNLRDVFGRFWILLFLLPLPLPQAGDGRRYKAAAAPAGTGARDKNNGAREKPLDVKGDNSASVHDKDVESKATTSGMSDACVGGNSDVRRRGNAKTIGRRRSRKT